MRNSWGHTGPNSITVGRGNMKEHIPTLLEALDDGTNEATLDDRVSSRTT